MLYIVFSLSDNWYIQTKKHNDSCESGIFLCTVYPQFKIILLLRQNASIQKS